MLTREQIFAAFAVDIATANDRLGKAEVLSIYTVAKACRVNFDTAMEECRKELKNRSDIKALAKQMTNLDKKFAIDISVQISVADGNITLRELQAVHYYSQVLKMDSSIVTTQYLKQLRKNPSLNYIDIE